MKPLWPDLRPAALLLAVLLGSMLPRAAAAHPASFGYDEYTGFPMVTECYCEQGQTCDCYAWYVALRWDDHAGPGLFGPLGGQVEAESALAALRRGLPGIVEGAAYCGNCLSTGQYRGQTHPQRAQSEIVDAISSSTHATVLPAYDAAARKGVELLRGQLAAPDGGTLAALKAPLRQYGRSLYAARLSIEPLTATLSWWGLLPALTLPRQQFYNGFPATLDPLTGQQVYWSAPSAAMAATDGIAAPPWGPVFPLGTDGALLQPLDYRNAFEARLTQLVQEAVGVTNELERAGYALYMAGYDLEVDTIRRQNEAAQSAYEAGQVDYEAAQTNAEGTAAEEEEANVDVVIRIEDDFGFPEHEVDGLAPATAELAPGITISLPGGAAGQGGTTVPPPVVPPVDTVPNRWAQHVGSYIGTYNLTDQHGWQWQLRVEVDVTPIGPDGLAVNYHSSGFSQGPSGAERQSYDYSGSGELSGAVISGTGSPDSYNVAGDIVLGQGASRCCIRLFDDAVVFSWGCSFSCDLVKQ